MYLECEKPDCNTVGDLFKSLKTLKQLQTCQGLAG
jgi:hypothetical protein